MASLISGEQELNPSGEGEGFIEFMSVLKKRILSRREKGSSQKTEKNRKNHLRQRK